MNKKKILWIILGVLDIAVVIFFFVVHIVMLSNVIGKNSEQIAKFASGDGLFAFLAGHIDIYGYAFVIPLFVVLAANIIGLVIYIRKTTKKQQVTVKDLTDEEKEALKKELLKDLEK